MCLLTFLSHSSSNGQALYTSPENGFVTDALYSVFQIPRDKPLRLNVPDNRTLTNSSEPSVGPLRPPTNSSELPPRHLESGTIVGIAIGATLGVISALALLLYIIHHHRMHKDSLSEPTPELHARHREELPAGLGEELPTNSIEELPANSREELWANEPAAVEICSGPVTKAHLS